MECTWCNCKLEDKNQTSWEKICQDLEMQLINETHAFDITTKLHGDEVWKLLMGDGTNDGHPYSSFWLTNKIPEIRKG